MIVFTTFGNHFVLLSMRHAVNTQQPKVGARSCNSSPKLWYTVFQQQQYHHTTTAMHTSFYSQLYQQFLAYESNCTMNYQLFFFWIFTEKLLNKLYVTWAAALSIEERTTPIWTLMMNYMKLYYYKYNSTSAQLDALRLTTNYYICYYIRSTTTYSSNTYIHPHIDKTRMKMLRRHGFLSQLSSKNT